MDLSVSLSGLSLRNPLLPGSGPPGDNLRKLKGLEAAGIGALVTKTISVELPDVPRPCMAFDGELFFNVEKWSARPYGEWLSDILPALKNRSVPLIVSLGYEHSDIEKLIPLFDEFVDGFELSTHYIARDRSSLLEFVKLAKNLTRKPVFIKLSVHGSEIVSNAVTCEQGGADGITAINSVGPVMSIDIEKRASRLGESEPYAWLSGPAVKPLAVRAVYDISRAVDIPVIACGGVSSGRDIIEFMLAGAAAVESCTTLLRQGYGWINRALGEVTEWCDKQGVYSLQEIVGTVTPHYISKVSKT